MPTVLSAGLPRIATENLSTQGRRERPDGFGTGSRTTEGSHRHKDILVTRYVLCRYFRGAPNPVNLGGGLPLNLWRWLQHVGYGRLNTS